MKLACLISGAGRTLQNFIWQIRDGKLDAEIVLVVSSDPDAYGVARAVRAGIPAVVVEKKRLKTQAFSDEITRHLDAANPDLVLMCGFLHLYLFPKRYEGRVLNIHPALLPGFGGKGMYGRRVHEAVLESGATESGCTVHFADLKYDHGPTILQRRVPVKRGDTPDELADRVFREECVAYPEAVRLVGEGKAKWTKRA